MAENRIRELERRARAGDEEAVGRLRAWKARLGECEHAFYVDKVERAMPLIPHHPDPRVGMSRGFTTTVRCEFCSFSRELTLAYNAFDELHRLQIRLEDNGKLTFVIDNSITDCFRLSQVRIGGMKWSPLGRSLVTNLDEWMYLSEYVVPHDREDGLVLQASASGAGDVRALKNGVAVAVMQFRPNTQRRNSFGQRIRNIYPLSRGIFVPGPLRLEDRIAIQMRHVPPEQEA